MLEADFLEVPDPLIPGIFVDIVKQDHAVGGKIVEALFGAFIAVQTVNHDDIIERVALFDEAAIVLDAVANKANVVVGTGLTMEQLVEVPVMFQREDRAAIAGKEQAGIARAIFEHGHVARQSLLEEANHRIVHPRNRIAILIDTASGEQRAPVAAFAEIVPAQAHALDDSERLGLLLWGGDQKSQKIAGIVEHGRLRWLFGKASGQYLIPVRPS
ncbi:hypothetical protein SAMN04515647_4137 [Cohaesibacter sp. ES.047]|nr:hypothetical protein SAMN04515647_4137 [Cohaesibacter sp. ES.047]